MSAADAEAPPPARGAAAAAPTPSTGAAPSAGARPGLPREALAGLGAMIAALAVLPFVLVFVISFGQNEDGAAWHWAFVFENYQRFFVGLEFPETFSTLYLERLWNSFLYSILGALIAVALAFPFTYALTRRSRATQT
ncbi:MAG: hypothetical protein AAFV86_17105, partial [Pseudomonadota bacterium]